MFEKVLVAERGEPALRILRCCTALGIRTVAVHSDADRQQAHVRRADEAVCIGPASPERSYHSAAALISAAEITGADAIHPGTGPLAASASFAEAVEASGFRFIGASASILRLLADRERLGDIVREAGLPGVPSCGRLPSTPDEVAALARDVGFPLILKAGDDGERCRVRVVHAPAAVLPALNQLEAECRRDATAGSIRIERYLDGSRHVEIQLLGDGLGRCVCLGVRDCSIRHDRRQLMAEAPVAGIAGAVLASLSARCADVVRMLGVRGLATIRLLCRGDEAWFMSMTARLDPAAAVTEVASEVDVVEAQVRVAAGAGLPNRPPEVTERGHAILCHLRAEHPFRFTPSSGRIDGWIMPGGPGIRVDTHCDSGMRIGPEDGGLLANVIAQGSTRGEAIARMERALAETAIEGIRTNLALFEGIMRDEGFRLGDVHIGYIDQEIAKRYRPPRRPPGAGRAGPR